MVKAGRSCEASWK